MWDIIECMGTMLVSYNALGGLIAISGALPGLVLVYIGPLIVNIIDYQRRTLNYNELPSDKIPLLKARSIESVNSVPGLIHHDSIVSSHAEERIMHNPSFFKTFCFYSFQFLLLLIGIITLIDQFVHYNIFNIKIQ